jgi:hypothetical protein
MHSPAAAYLWNPSAEQNVGKHPVLRKVEALAKYLG